MGKETKEIESIIKLLEVLKIEVSQEYHTPEQRDVIKRHISELYRLV